jgi:hypothetical protein
MKTSEIASMIGGAIGAVGGVLGLVTWWQVQRDRRRKLKDEQAYQAWATSIEMSLGPGHNLYRVKPDERRWAARAVAENRLEWAPGGVGVMLPGMTERS